MLTEEDQRLADSAAEAVSLAYDIVSGVGAEIEPELQTLDSVIEQAEKALAEDQDAVKLYYDFAQRILGREQTYKELHDKHGSVVYKGRNYLFRVADHICGGEFLIYNYDFPTYLWANRVGLSGTINNNIISVMRKDASDKLWNALEERYARQEK